MTALRKILTTGLALLAGSAMASASSLTIGYTTSLGPTSTDITNFTVELPSWNPGGSNSLDFIQSDVSAPGYTTGVTMNSLTGNYVLTGFNVSVNEELIGDYTITNTSTNSNAQGSVSIDTYTAVAIGAALNPPLSSTADPNNDLFNCSVTTVGKASNACAGNHPGEQSTSLGGGPDPNSPATATLDLAPGATFTASPFNVDSGWVDFGCEVQANRFCSDVNDGAAAGAELSSGFGMVEASSGLIFNFSTLTSTDPQLSSGNVTTTFSTSVLEQVEVTYTFSQAPSLETGTVALTGNSFSPSPEPGTIALMGGALLGLGLIRKRFWQK